MRPTDLAWEALVEVTGATVSSERGALNASLKQIREAVPDLTDEELADEIRHRAKVYRETWPSIALTPTALAKHWERVPLEAPKPTYSQAPTNVTCMTCKGHKLVLVMLRPALDGVTGHNDHGFEEYAPCPDCNLTADAGWWRPDGTQAKPIDPAQIRRMMYE